MGIRGIMYVSGALSAGTDILKSVTGEVGRHPEGDSESRSTQTSLVTGISF